MTVFGSTLDGAGKTVTNHGRPQSHLRHSEEHIAWKWNTPLCTKESSLSRDHAIHFHVFQSECNKNLDRRSKTVAAIRPTQSHFQCSCSEHRVPSSTPTRTRLSHRLQSQWLSAWLERGEGRELPPSSSSFSAVGCKISISSKGTKELVARTNADRTETPGIIRKLGNDLENGEWWADPWEV